MAENVVLSGRYLGMSLTVTDIDVENLDYFKHCGAHDYRLQHCARCDLVRYPPTTACPWCASDEWTWKSVEPRGVVFSYSQVEHAIMPAFREHLPYLLLLVELDTQRGQPSEHEAIRIWGNLTDVDGDLASREECERVGIGTRVRMVFKDVGDGFAIPQWTVDESAPQPVPWRYQD